MPLHKPLPLSKQVYTARRKRLLSQLAPRSAAIFVSNPEQVRSNDTEHKYRQSSNLLYLCGFPEADSALVLTNIQGFPRCSLFVRPKDRVREIWTGIRIGVDGAKRRYWCDAAYPVDQFKEFIARLLPKADKAYYRLGRNLQFDKAFEEIWADRQKPLLNPDDVVGEMRLFKDRREIDLIHHAAALSANAHRLAMRACRPGIYEYQLAALLEFAFLHGGAQAPAYGSIVAGGNNAIVLHYTENSSKLRSGDLVLIDAACEYEGYASDITRTFPVNGRFTQAQKEIYELVLSAQLAAIKAARPGVPLARVHDVACRVLARGLVKLGILRASAINRRGMAPPCPVPKQPGCNGRSMLRPYLRSQDSWHSQDRQPGQRAHHRLGAQERAWRCHAPTSLHKSRVTLFDFYPHGTSHWLGIDVHDVGDYKTEDGTRSDRGRGKRRVLEPGMVITVEPGLYFDAADKRVPAKYRGMGIRIEDDVLITKKGSEVLTAGVPKNTDDIEELMSSIG